MDSEEELDKCNPKLVTNFDTIKEESKTTFSNSCIYSEENRKATLQDNPRSQNSNQISSQTYDNKS